MSWTHSLVALSTFAISAYAGAGAATTATTAAEQKQLVEALSGAAHLGIGGLPSVISQRFSDSPEIFTTAQYLKAKYDELGIPADVLEYNPLDAYPYYYRDIDDTYRSYFQKLIPMLRDEFNGLCDGALDEKKRDAVLKRLERVGLTQSALCKTAAAGRVELYVKTVVDHTTAGTKEMLENRKLATWPNVMAFVATSARTGEIGGRPLCVVGAHMDSVARGEGNRGPITSPTTLAPGADDNASGTAAVFALARALRDWVAAERPELPCDLAFVHFSGEEEGLLGSSVFAHLQVDRPILWMVNFDMIAYNKAPQAVMNVGYNKRFGRQMAEAFLPAPAKLKVAIVEKETFIYSSDQISFWGKGVPAISISEQACADEACAERYKYFNPYLHTPHDTVEHLDFDYAATIVNHSYGGLKNLLTYKRR